MTHYDIANIIGEFVNRRMQPEDYDSLANFGQTIRFRQCLDSGDELSLRPFIKVMGTDSDTPPLYVSTLGIATLPSDYFRYKSMTIFDNGVEYQVEVLDDFEFDNRKSHKIETPTKHYPIATIRADQVVFIPRNLQYVNMVYYAPPQIVHYAVDTSKGWAKYDTVNSIEFEWDNDNIIKIIIIMLQSLGIVANEEQVKEKLTNNLLT